MKHIISFENDNIVYIAGSQKGKKIAVDKTESFPFAPEDEASRRDALSALVKKYSLAGKKADVVLPSKGLLLRELYVPGMKNKKQQREVVMNEMLYYHSNLSEFAVDFLPTGRVNDDGQKGFVACAINRSVFEDYVQLFTEAGIKPSSVDVMADCVSKLVSMAGFSDKTVIFVEVNNSHTELYLLDRGCPVFTRRLNFKYISFSGNVQILAEELAEQINKLLQFQRTRHVSERVSEVIIGGDAPGLDSLTPMIYGELEALRPSEVTCTQLPLSQVLIVPDGCDLNIGLKAAGAVLKRDMNFLRANTAEKSKTPSSPVFKNRAVIFLAAYAFILIVFPLAAGKITEHILDSKTEAIMAFNTTADEAQEYQRLLKVQQEYLSLKSENDSLEMKEEAIRALPQMTNEVYGALTSQLGEGVRITGVTYSAYGGMLSVSLSGPGGGSATSYVENLRNSGYFASVSYTGWSTQESCFFTVSCAVKGADL